MYTLKIKTHDADLTELYTNHKHAYPGDAGIDLYTSSNVIVPGNALGVKIPLSVQLELVDAHNNNSMSYFIVARSSIYKTPLRLSQAICIIDSGYRGELYMFVDNLSDQSYRLAKGERYFQVISPTFNEIVPKLVSNLSEGLRENKGLGSSGLSLLSKL